MKKLLIVVDMQNDFIDGSLGTKEAVAIVPKVIEKIKSWDGDIICTRDTHFKNYLETREGQHLPVPHCIRGTFGHKINKDVQAALEGKTVAFIDKYTFGSDKLPLIILKMDYNYIELAGLCTDICVVSNALNIKMCFPEMDIAVDAACCAGVTPESHNAALLTMKMCQIDIVGGNQRDSNQ